MALLCGSTSVTFPSSSAKPSFASSKNEIAKTSFVGFQLAFSNHSIQTNFPTNARRNFQVRCQDLSLIPKEERWMFEESEVNGQDIWNNLVSKSCRSCEYR
ncbi:hypothetical protein L6164_018281 [Bauhinia variegata]|uniref:Uncharacterized protein n=1 Tax=Bauhinia variegata TaxID=167791 RepID=A0ACB9NCF7_BAUVA|nr:hypothetical protein L6164_018281 [Bauhinia variegata]